MLERIRRRRGDLLLLGGFLLIGCIIGIVLLYTGSKGGEVQVRVAGEIRESYPLGEDRTVEVKGIGGGSNLLVIEDGKAYISEATCPDKVCIGMGKISRRGESVVCLPNQVVIEVVSGSEKETDDIDIIVK